MESLLCNEVWPMSPSAVLDDVQGNVECKLVKEDVEDCREVFVNFVVNEEGYLPEAGYLKLLLMNNDVCNLRFKAVKWLLKFRERLNVSVGTVFIAVNCLDRFVSFSQCQGWKDWMFELLSIACLSVAAKFNETATFSLCEFQGEGLNHTFAPSLIQRMELTLLKGLGWRVASTTSFSYVEFMIQRVNVTLEEDLMATRVTELLINTLLDPMFLEFRPSVIAVSAIRCLLGNFAPLMPPTDMHTVILQDKKDDLNKCQRSIEKLQLNLFCGHSFNSPSSPVTVFNFCDCPVINGCPASIDDRSSSQKRKREEIKR